MYPAHTAGVAARFIDLRSGIRIRVAESGPNNGAPVVLLHGWGASLYTFRHAFEPLAARGFRAIAADLRGFGLSDRPSYENSYHLKAYLEDLDALVDSLGRGPVSLIGHSMGGGLSLHYALSRPERVTALALINPTGLVPVPAMTAARLTPRWLIEGVGERLAPRWLVEVILERIAYGDASLVTARDVDEYWAPTQIAGYIRATRRTASEFNWDPITTEQASALAVRTTVVLGTRDVLVRDAARAASGLRRAMVREFPGGHCVHEELPSKIYPLVAARLAEQGGELPSSSARID
jgi:pimeloyl-ACP methyl ester carboxylesterase